MPLSVDSLHTKSVRVGTTGMTDGKQKPSPVSYLHTHKYTITLVFIKHVFEIRKEENQTKKCKFVFLKTKTKTLCTNATKRKLLWIQSYYFKFPVTLKNCCREWIKPMRACHMRNHATLSALSPPWTQLIPSVISSLFKIYFIDYTITAVPTVPFAKLYTATPIPTGNPPTSFMSMVMHVSSLATPFPILYFTSPWLFHTYLFVLLNPFTFPPCSPMPLPKDNPPNDLHIYDSVSVLVCLAFLYSIAVS